MFSWTSRSARSAFRRCGMFSQLAKSSDDAHAWLRLYALSSHAGSQRLPALFPHRVVSEIRYVDYVFPETGKKPFLGIAHEKCVAYLVDN